MREKSFSFTKHDSQSPNYRGGEKKVMKKSLSVILASALAFSSFASAFAAEATAPKTAQEMYDALKAKNIFEGRENGAELDKTMTRAEFAKIIVKLLGLTENATGAAAYTDVDAKHWGIGFIGAVTPKYMEGPAAGKFNPEGQVSQQELATILVRATGLTVEANATVTGKVDDWAKGYVAAAIKAGIIPAGTDFTKAATRAELVSATFVAQDKVVPATGKLSLKEVKPTGVKTVAVAFNKAVDDTVTKLELKKGSVVVATTAKFADDKKSATLSLTDVKLSEGVYSVSITGLAADQIETGKAEFTAENEKVAKLEFVSASDTLADSTNVIVKMKASNQYGENASFSAGSYTVNAKVGTVDLYKKLSKNDQGELLLYLNTSSPTIQSGIGIIPVIVYHNDTRVTASKNFKKGTPAFITKMELGTVKYSNGKDSINLAGETAIFDLVNYDQYGNIIAYDAARDNATQAFVSPYEAKIQDGIVAGDDNNDEIADIKVALTSNIDKAGEYTLTVYNQAGTGTVKIKVNSAKIATKLEIGDLSDYIAAGDDDAFVPLTGYDASGNVLSADDLVSTENRARINVTASGAVAALETAGENKGKIKLTALPNAPKTVISVMAYITSPNTVSNVNKTFTVSEARIPDSIKVTTEPAKKIVAEAESKFKFVVYDQYGKELKKFKYVDSNGAVVNSTSAVGLNQYKVEVSASSTDGSIAAWNTQATHANGAGAAVGNFSVSSSTYYYDTWTNPVYDLAGNLVTAGFWSSAIGDKFNQEHKFVTNASITGAAEISAVVWKSSDNGATWTPSTNKVTRKIEAFDTRQELIYSVNAVADLYNAISNATDSINNKTVREYVYGTGVTETISVATQIDASLSKFAREVSVSAKDTAGNTVAIPKRIKQITSSDSAVAMVDTNWDTAPADKINTKGFTENKAFVIGNAKGTATLNVSFQAVKGETQVKSVAVNVKDTPITADKITTKNQYALPTGATTNLFTLADFKVFDNYGVEYATANAQKYNYLFGVVFAVKNPEFVVTATGAPATGTITVDEYGILTITTAAGVSVKSFEVTATAASGKSKTFFFK